MIATPWETFLYALAVVCAILTPVFALIVLKVIGEMWSDWCKYHIYKAEEAAKRGPYTKAELRRVPNENMLEIVLYDGERIAYRVGVDKP